jgi:hypothetical protein
MLVAPPFHCAGASARVKATLRRYAALTRASCSLRARRLSERRRSVRLRVSVRPTIYTKAT